MTVRKGFTLFLVIAFSVSLAVLGFSVDASTLSLVAKAHKGKVLLALGLVALMWCLDAWKFICLTRAAGEKLHFRLAMLLVWLNYFGCAITPMQSGGGPFQIYLLYRNGISVGKGFAITLVRTLLTLFILGLAFPFALVLEPDLLQGHHHLKGFVTYVLLFLMATWIIVTLSLVKPGWIKRWTRVGTLWLKRFGVVKPQKVLRIIRHISKEIDIYNDNIRQFCTTGRNDLLLAAGIAFLQLVAQLSVLPCLIWAMGLPVEYSKAVLLQALFLFLLYFVPTPGGSGAAEGGAAAVFRLLVPWNLAGLMAVSWRFLTEYTGIFLGTWVALRYLGWNLAEQLLQEKGKDEEDNGDSL